MKCIYFINLPNIESMFDEHSTSYKTCGCASTQSKALRYLKRKFNMPKHIAEFFIYKSADEI